ncbi:tetratricopeptide repeat protein [Desulfobacter curvatus]|uniref:tetratricopeptide repeat protein n=1 Tax=Desulfobacter curvatus TaxID=2290 RepID=UPI00037358C4|nr:tetratricopeptide repeat protein [Desulfobacter curvatus]
MGCVCPYLRFSKLFLTLLTAVILFSCTDNLDQLNEDAKKYVESEVTRITTGWKQGLLMASVYPGVREEFKLQTVNQIFFLYKKLGALQQINDITGQVAITRTSGSDKTITGTYQASAEYENGPAVIHISCVMDNEKWYITGFRVNSPVFEDLPPVSGEPAEDDNEPADTAALEKEVADLLATGDTIAIRKNIKKLKTLAKIYEASGSDADLIRMLEKILEADATDLSSQFKLATLLAKNGDGAKAQEKALQVYNFTEDEKLIDQARQFLKDSGFQVPPLPEPAPVQTDIEIVMVPMGDVNMQLLYELRVLLQEKIGLNITLSNHNIDPGPCDRKASEPFLKNVCEEIRKSLSQTQHQAILDNLDATDEELASSEGQSRYIWKYFSFLGENGKKYRETYYEALLLREDMEQYLAGSLIERLRLAVPFGENNKVKGYLGVTSKGLYCPTCNFLYGNAEWAYGVISYDGFLAAHNNEGDNRPRLVKRLLKQALSTANFMLGIPRCNTPFCARAYPHSLQEHDAKSDNLCPVCQSRLAQFKKDRVFETCALSLCEQGNALLKAGNPDAAEKCFRRARKEAPGHSQVYGMIGDGYFAVGRFDQAVNAWQKAYKLNPKDIYMFNMGLAYYKNDAFQSALDAFTLLLEKKPDDAQVLGWVGTCYARMKECPKAISYLQKAIAIDPGDIDRFQYLAACFNQTGQTDKAIRTMEEMAGQFPDHYIGYYYLARQFMGKDHAKAIKNFKKTIELNPGLVPAYEMLGVSLARDGKREEAIGIFKKGITIDGNHDSLFNSLGYTYYQEKRYDQAIDAYSQALTLNPNFALCHYNKALAHYALEQFSLAEQHLNTAADLGYKGSPAFRRALYKKL